MYRANHRQDLDGNLFLTGHFLSYSNLRCVINKRPYYYYYRYSYAA